MVAGVTAETRDGKVFSIFNVIKFPNSECAGTNSLNGTCYTNTECTSLGGTSSGSCASGFGVCCVFSLACGGTTSANVSYAQITTFSTATDTTPCTYTYCKNSDDICKLRYGMGWDGMGWDGVRQVSKYLVSHSFLEGFKWNFQGMKV